MSNSPKSGSIWKYKTGKVYKVLFMANVAHTHPDHPVEVVYQGSNGHYWTYDFSKWHDNFEELPHDPGTNYDPD